ncbi:MAG: class I SAM-dependent methyltransferase [Myxococcales bacterium]|nr:class I SAM-dependent methyltransferase [Myxococcales bacterium]
MTTTDAKFWDSIAEKYAAQPVKDVAAFDRKKAFCRRHLSRDAKVFEIGCGTGSLALAMAPHAGEIHAMDVSAEMVRIANDKKAAQRARNVTFHCGTLEEAPFDDGSFDAVWAFSILHLIEDRHAALRRCYALLKPGGVLIASNVCLGDSWIPYRPMIAVMRWLGKAPKVHFYDRCTIVTELEEAGFEGVEEVDVGADDLVAFTVAHKA